MTSGLASSTAIASLILTLATSISSTAAARSCQGLLRAALRHGHFQGSSLMSVLGIMELGVLAVAQGIQLPAHLVQLRTQPVDDRPQVGAVDRAPPPGAPAG